MSEGKEPDMNPVHKLSDDQLAQALEQIEDPSLDIPETDLNAAKTTAQREVNRRMNNYLDDEAKKSKQPIDIEKVRLVPSDQPELGSRKVVLIEGREIPVEAFQDNDDPADPYGRGRKSA